MDRELIKTCARNAGTSLCVGAIAAAFFTTIPFISSASVMSIGLYFIYVGSK